MTKQTKWALGVLAFVFTVTVARRVGQFEMKDQAEKQIAVLQQRITKLQEENELRRQGDRSFCEHVMLLSGAYNNKQPDILFNAQGNYKKNAFELFERMGGKR